MKEDQLCTKEITSAGFFLVAGVARMLTNEPIMTVADIGSGKSLNPLKSIACLFPEAKNLSAVDLFEISSFPKEQLKGVVYQKLNVIEDRQGFKRYLEEVTSNGRTLIYLNIGTWEKRNISQVFSDLENFSKTGTIIVSLEINPKLYHSKTRQLESCELSCFGNNITQWSSTLNKTTFYGGLLGDFYLKFERKTKTKEKSGKVEKIEIDCIRVVDANNDMTIKALKNVQCAIGEILELDWHRDILVNSSTMLETSISNKKKLEIISFLKKEGHIRKKRKFS